jgi:hypothetical protein
MRRFLLLLPALLLVLTPILACNLGRVSQVTPTPTKTPRRILALDQTRTPTVTLTPAVTDTPTPLPPTDTPTPLPPTDTPTPLPPTDTPPPPPTNTPVPPPPPPPTDTPPPPPTDTPAPPPPTQPPASQTTVSVELPDGNKFGKNDKVKIVFVVRNPEGVKEFTWGIFTQNQTSLKGGKHECGGTTECRLEVKENAPPISGTYIVGADALGADGKIVRGIGEIYVR